MAGDLEKHDKQERAARLKQARLRAKLSGPKGVYDASGGSISIETYKGHESGRNGFSVVEGRKYADLFAVPLTWLYLGIGRAQDTDLPGATLELRRAFAAIADAPEAVQAQVLAFIRFSIGSAEALSPPQPDQHRGRSAPATHRHEAEPSR